MRKTHQVPIHHIIPWLATLLLLLALLSLSPTSGQGSGEYSLWLPLVSNQPVNSNPVLEGIATYYNATGDGACMFGSSPEDLMVSAMNAVEYDNAAACGAYVHVIGPKGQVIVRIVDLCPECLAGHLDLSREAFASIADLPQGRVDITWQVVSPDLTANEPDKQVISGGPITRDITGEEVYSTIYALRESTIEAGVLWAGANDGPVHVSRDNGKTWKKVTPGDLPPGGRVKNIEPSPHRKGVAAKKKPAPSRARRPRR